MYIEARDAYAYRKRELQDLAQQAFGLEAASAFMTRPCGDLDDQSPQDLARTAEGTWRVKSYLWEMLTPPLPEQEDHDRMVKEANARGEDTFAQPTEAQLRPLRELLAGVARKPKRPS